MFDRIIATYRDGVIISAVRGSFGDVGYAITGRRETVDGEVVGTELLLDEREARELAAALAWIISEVDKKNGKPSFRPPAKRGVTHDNTH
jgi:hypothetical protein